MNRSKEFYVSMPYLGLSSFLQLESLKTMAETLMFQCPTSGFLLFYAKDKDVEQMIYHDWFQCPTSGFLLFYSCYLSDTSWCYGLFQCPTSGFLLFYEFYNYRRHQAKIAFQCPTSGFLLFYGASQDLLHSK